MPQPIEPSNINSEEVQDIIGRTPSKIILKGNVYISIIVIVLIIVAWCVRFPDVVSAPVRIISSEPPIKMIAQASGKVTEIYAKDGDLIRADEIIAVIDNAANINDVLCLKKVVEVLDTAINIENAICNIQLPKNFQVGEMQAEYAALCQAINNYRFLASNKYYNKKITDINSQKDDNVTIEKNIRKKENILNDQLKLELWKDSANKILLEEKAISLEEYNETKKAFLGRHINNSDNSVTELQNNQQQKEYQKNIWDIQHQLEIDEISAVFSVKDAVEKLKGQEVAWEKQYLLRAPAQGKLVFFQVRKPNQYIVYGESVFMVVPTIKQYEVQVQLPLYKSGKVKIGQSALIKLSAYPFEEFGMLKAKVADITTVAMDSVYSVGLILENGSTTTLHQQLALGPEITGTADIITNNKNILMRIFEGVYGIANKK